jgi:hypothetical protein
MKVTLKRTGGFAGVTHSVELDVDAMTPEEAAELEALVAAADVPRQRGAMAAPGRDRFGYVITIEEEGSRHVLRTGEVASPPVQRLIDYLTEAGARRARDIVRSRGGGEGKRHEEEH